MKYIITKKSYFLLVFFIMISANKGWWFIKAAKTTMAGLVILGGGFYAVLWAKQSELFTVQENDLRRGTFAQVMMNAEQELELLPTAEALGTLETAIIWDTTHWEWLDVPEQKAPSTRSNVPELWLGGGNDGVLMALDSNFKVEFRTNLPYPEVTALLGVKEDKALGIADALYVASGPNGALYMLRRAFVGNEVTYELFKVATFAEPFIWDLHLAAETGMLYVAVGGNARGAVYAIDVTELPSNQIPLQPRQLFSVAEANVVKLLRQKDVLLAASSPTGKLYAYQLNHDTLVTLYDSYQGDIADFVWDAARSKVYLATTHAGNATAYRQSGQSARGGAVSPPASPPAPGQNGTPNLCPPQTAEGNAKVGQTTPALNCFHAPAIYELTMADNGLAYGVSSIVRRLYVPKNGNITQMVLAKTQDRLIYTSAETGMIEALSLKQLASAILYHKEHTVIAKMLLWEDDLYLVELETGAFYRWSSAYSQQGIYTSEVLAFYENANWGRMGYDNYSQANKVRIETRSGQTYQPAPPAKNGGKASRQGEAGTLVPAGASWSKWEALGPGGKIISPPAVHMQFRVILAPTGNTSPRLRNFHFYHVGFNTVPELASIQIIRKRNEPPPQQPRPQERGNKKEDIYTYLNNLSQHARQYVLSWNVLANDNDILRYTLAIKRLGDPVGQWVVLAKHFFNHYFTFDNRTFPDGRYQFRLTYDDYLSNGVKQGFIREKLSPFHIIDNTPPSIEIMAQTQASLTVRVQDKLSPIARLFYSFDRENYYELDADDGINDDLVENFTLRLATLEQLSSAAAPQQATELAQKYPKLLLVALDAAGNVTFAYPP